MSGLSRPLSIGPYRLPNPLILAPMAGITDRPFRILCRRHGAAAAISEMVAADTALWGTRKSLHRLDYRDEPGPVWAQIVGADPDLLAAAARRVVEQGAQIVDLNMGCPARKVCQVAAGSALLRDETRVARILDAVVAAVEVPVTLKIRTGWCPQTRNAVAIARIAEACGIAALTVHGRTRACGYGVPAEYDSLRAVRAAVGIALIANGDIRDAAGARQVLHSTGADAIMIGRAARGRPWIFDQLATGLAADADVGPQHGPPVPPPGWGEVVREHLESLYAFYGADAGVRIARKHIAWYCGERPGAARFRAEINAITTPAGQLARVLACLDQHLV